MSIKKKRPRKVIVREPEAPILTSEMLSRLAYADRDNWWTGALGYPVSTPPEQAVSSVRRRIDELEMQLRRLNDYIRERSQGGFRIVSISRYASEVDVTTFGSPRMESIQMPGIRTVEVESLLTGVRTLMTGPLAEALIGLVDQQENRVPSAREAERIGRQVLGIDNPRREVQRDPVVDEYIRKLKAGELPGDKRPKPVTLDPDRAFAWVKK